MEFLYEKGKAQIKITLMQLATIVFNEETSTVSAHN